MKIQKINPALLKRRERTKKPSLIISKAGVFILNQAASELLNVNPGSFIEFGYDHLNSKDWYISRGITGFKLRDKNQLGTCFTCISLRRIISKCIGLTDDLTSLKFLIATQPTTDENGQQNYAIITHNML